MSHTDAEIGIVALQRDPRRHHKWSRRLVSSKCPAILVGITVFNETVSAVLNTVVGICQAVRTIQRRLKDDAFVDRVVVCLVFDGVDNISFSVLQFLSDVGLYHQDVVDRARHEYGLDVGAFIFETQHAIQDSSSAFHHFPPLQLISCIKQHNGGKIDSHWWYFEAFADALQPTYCFLLDAGTMPQPSSFYSLYRSFEQNRQIAGACGEITVDPMQSMSMLSSAQTFEYKVASILEKAFESVFGYISVLPGAFSCYRYKAVRGFPLRQYFRFTETPFRQMTPFQANQYLAEDRLLCFELFCRKDMAYTLHYIHGAEAATDVPATLVDLMKQRRRWINGSLFSVFYALHGFSRVLWETKHSPARKIAVAFEFAVLLLSCLVAWFSLSIFNLIMGLLMWSFTPFLPFGARVGLVLVLSLVLLSQFIVGIGSTVNRSRFFYGISCLYLGSLFVSLSVTFIIDAFQSTLPTVSVSATLISILFTFGIYFVAALLHGDISTIVLHFCSYWFLLPTFVVLFPIHAMCNLDDVSWGTKKAEATKQDDDVRQSFRQFRTHILLAWITSNLLCAMLLLHLHIEARYLIPALLYAMVSFNGLKFIGSSTFLLLRLVAERRDQIKLYQQQRLTGHWIWRHSFPVQLVFALRTISAPFHRYTLLCFSEFIYLHCIYGACTFIWCLTTSVLCLFLSLVPIPGWQGITFVAASWRLLGNVELLLFAHGGVTERIKQGKKAHSYPAPALFFMIPPSSDSRWSFGTTQRILRDKFTRQALSHFTLERGILLCFNMALVYFFGVALTCIVGQWLPLSILTGVFDSTLLASTLLTLPRFLQIVLGYTILVSLSPLITYLVRLYHDTVDLHLRHVRLVDES